MIFLPHTSTVILLEPYCGTITEPGLPVILLKHLGYDNFELNWFHGLSKSPAIPFSQVSADSFRFNIQECSRSFYAFIASRL